MPALPDPYGPIGGFWCYGSDFIDGWQTEQLSDCLETARQLKRASSMQARIITHRIRRDWFFKVNTNP